MRRIRGPAHYAIEPSAPCDKTCTREPQFCAGTRAHLLYYVAEVHQRIQRLLGGMAEYLGDKTARARHPRVPQAEPVVHIHDDHDGGEEQEPCPLPVGRVLLDSPR